MQLNKFIWVHADVEKNTEIILNLAEKGIWMEFDFIGREKEFSWQIQALKYATKNNLLDRLLLSQDAGTFYFGKKNDKSTIIPYNRIFKEFIPKCIASGISKEIFQKLLVENPLKVLKNT